MKTNRLYRVLRAVIVFLAGAFVMACGETNPEPETKPDITIDVSCLDVFASGIRVEAEPQGGTFTKDVLFTTTDKWAASITGEGSTGWIMIQPTSGTAGSASMKVSVAKNESENNRKADVVIACGEVKKSFTVTQDGKKEQGEENPVLYNYSAAESSDVNVISYDYQGGVLRVELPEDKIPKVGDIICSGRTEEAPYGYLFKVGSVTVSNTKSADDIVKKYTTLVAGAVTAYEVFQTLGISVKQWYDLVEVNATFSDAEGHTIDPLKDKDGISVFNLDVPLEISDGVKIRYTHELSVPRCSIYLDTESPNMVLGYDVLFKNSDLIHINAKNKGIKKKGDFLAEKALKNPAVTHVYDLQIGPVPIVITTLLKPMIPYEFSMTANLDMDVYKKVWFNHMGGYYHVMFDSFTPLEGNTDFMSIVDGSDDGEYGAEYSDREFSATIEGKASIGFDLGYSVGLYGGNLFDKDGDHTTGLNYFSIGANFGLKFEDKMSFGGMTNLDEESHNTVRIVDDNKFMSYLYGKIWGTVLSAQVLGADIEVLTGEKEWQFVKTEYYWPFFFPSYSDLKVNSITRQDFINVTAKKHKPLFGGAHAAFREQDYGLCVESFDGKDYWVFSLAGIPINGHTGEFSFDIPLDISNLRRNVKYSVYPYSKVSNFLLRGEEKMVCRKGVSFTITDDGQLSTATIDDIPGTQL